MIDIIIRNIHIALFCYGLMVPFVGSIKELKSFSFIIPVLLFHWATNDDTCFLTQLEAYFSNKSNDRTFIGRIVGPIYNLDDNTLGKFTKSIFFLLWVFVQYKLGNMS